MARRWSLYSCGLLPPGKVTLVHEAIDKRILAAVHDRWQKVAKVIVLVQRDFPSASEEQIAERIGALVRHHRLQGAGDLSKWRYSEVRLPSRLGPPVASH